MTDPQQRPTTSAPSTSGASDRPDTPDDVLDQAVMVVTAAAPAWVTADLDYRLGLLEQARGDTLAAADDWVVDAQRAKGISRDQRASGDEWLNGPVLLARNLRLLHRSLTDVVTTGRPRPAGISTRDDGRTVVRAVPGDAWDRLLLPGVVGDVVLRDGVSVEEVEDRLGEVYRPGGRPHHGEVAVVLGAGNVSSIPPMDVLSQLYGRLRTVVLKMSPVTDWLAPHLGRALRAFVEADLLRIVHGGPEVGRHLVHHDDVDAVHLTGSDRTHDAVVFGVGEDGAARKANDDPVVDKDVTAELGNVSPVIVVPGPWSADDIAVQADSIASMLVNNGGFNCVSARVLVTHAHWNRRDALLDGLAASLDVAEDRQAWYPGAEDRHREFVDAHEGAADHFGGDTPGSLPYTLLRDVDPSDPDHPVFTHEAFCGVFGEVGLDVPRSVVAFLDRAVDFANDVLWGTLSAALLVHPRSLEDPAVRDAVERAIDRLEYGTVVVNDWSALAYGTVSLPWGAAPGATRTDIQSGRGFVHNTWLVPDDLVHKSVLRAPFAPVMGRFTSHTSERSAEVGRLLTEFEATGRRSNLARLALAQLRA